LDVLYQFGKVALRVLSQLVWRVKFSHLSVVEHEYAVGLDNCLEPVGNNDHSAVFEASLH
jgi:hypothetical protein